MLNSLIQNAALELSPFGVRVNGVAPGITQTQIRVSDVFSKKSNDEYLEKIGDFFLLGKQILQPNDIVNSVMYLASDQAEFVTGEIITNDNGFLLNHDMSFMDDDDK